MSTKPDHQARDLQRARDHRAAWLAIAGAKGGVGKTMIASNLALLLARAGYRTLLVDFDPGCGNVAVHLRLSTTFDLEDVAANRCRVRDAIVRGPGRLDVLLGRSGPSKLAGAARSELDPLLDELREAATAYDVVIVDTGAGLGTTTMHVVEQADLTLAVTTPEVTALTDTYALCKVLHLRQRPLPRLVVNRGTSRNEAMRTAGKLATITGKFLGVRTELCGFVSDDDAVRRSIGEQRPVAMFGEGPALDDLRSLCAATLAALPRVTRGRQRQADDDERRLRPQSYGKSP